TRVAARRCTSGSVTGSPGTLGWAAGATGSGNRGEHVAATVLAVAVIAIAASLVLYEPRERARTAMAPVRHTQVGGDAQAELVAALRPPAPVLPAAPAPSEQPPRDPARAWAARVTAALVAAPVPVRTEVVARGPRIAPRPPAAPPPPVPPEPVRHVGPRVAP